MDMGERKQQLNKRTIEDYEYVKSIGYNILGVFVQGSDNYSLSWEGSDIDTKVILIPSFIDFVLNRKPISTTLIKEDNSHIDLKDIRLMHECFRKQNINFLEILFTPYCWINPKYFPYWDSLVSYRESIGRYNQYRAINAMRGMAYEKFAQMEKSMPHNAAEVEKYGYEPKQLSHIMRLNDFVERYIADMSFKSCLIPSNRDEIMNAKLGNYSLEDARNLARELLKHIDELCTNYCDTHEPSTNHLVDIILDSAQEDIIKVAMKTELEIY